MAQGSRGDDYQNRRENSPRREETPTHSPGWSDDEVYKGPLSRQIMDLELPRALQKPPQLGKYDGLTDPDIHIQNIDAILNYQAVKGGIKCRIFPTTLVEGAMAWYRSLPQGSITSWKDLCKQFTSHFTASRKHPKTEANLEAVRQGPNETLRSYIERFNKEAVQVDVTDDMKKYLMRKNLRDGTKFKEMVAIEKPATWDEILHKAQAYMQGFLAKINTKHHFTFVEHPQTNGQAEAANRVILRGLRRRLGDAKKQWVEELSHVLWAYRTTPHSTTGETPFRLAYGTEAVIPVEIGEPSRRTEAPLDEEMNDEAMREELDLVEEIRTSASLKEASLKQRVAARHDTKVIKRDFEVGSLVLRRNAKDSHEGKLAANWEGPYRVRGKTDNGAYHLETLQGKEIPRTQHLLLKQRAELLDNGCRAGTRAHLKTLKVNSELNTRAEPLPDGVSS
ncbi:hypothetical protein TSUD_10960 [Trifolium subterraneum]|nr:hypothetical protein TSUD_10960 [Trifolium subterraneum]